MTSQARDEKEMLSKNRRLLLKAAATAGPLIATLPSGAARATTSAAACIANDKAASENGQYDELVANGPNDTLPDTTVRFPGWYRPDCKGVDYVYVEMPSGSSWYNTETGEAVSSNPVCRGRVGLPPGHSRSGDREVAVLVHYKPTEDFTDVDPSAFYPVTKINVDDNMGITATCLCSVSPGLMPDGALQSCNHA